jgi:glycosyltransferase involved in cell wall biosynthesis
MKVLWFSNTPASGEEVLGNKNVRGGWLKSLDKLLANHVELHVAFEYPKKVDDFENNGIFYHPITPNSIISSWFLMLKNILTNVFKDRENLNKYINLITKVNPDIIHIHGTENSFSVILKSNLNIPLVLSIQGVCVVINYKYFNGLSKALSSKRNHNNIISFLFEKTFYSDFKYSAKRAMREQEYIKLHKNFIGRTDWDRRITSVLSPGRGYFHNDEVLRDVFYKNQWHNINNSEEIIIHSTMGTNYFKGIEVVLLASHFLNTYGLKHKWKIAGISEGDLIVQIAKKHIKVKQVDNNIIYLGNIDENKLIEHLLSSHIYVMPSHIENSPNNLCEAMILGMPCIATHAGGSSSLISDKEDGLLIQTGDPWSMAGAILELNQDFERAIELGKKARKRALIRHNKEKIVSDLVDIYTNIINNN